MTAWCRRWIVLVGLACVAAGGASARSPQVELDRIVSRVAGRPIMQSDIQQARSLHLVPDVSSDAAALRGLENRWLMLDEMARAAPVLPVPDDAVNARLAAWRDRQGAAAPLLPMGEAELRSWLRDDLRIEAYLDRRFGMLSDADRARARDEWVTRLRQRAGLD